MALYSLNGLHISLGCRSSSVQNFLEVRKTVLKFNCLSCLEQKRVSRENPPVPAKFILGDKKRQSQLLPFNSNNS